MACDDDPTGGAPLVMRCSHDLRTTVRTEYRQCACGGTDRAMYRWELCGVCAAKRERIEEYVAEADFDEQAGF
jgi:hypothetical protein